MMIAGEIVPNLGNFSPNTYRCYFIQRFLCKPCCCCGGASRSRTDLHGFAIREAEYAPP
jgi:hypothetical protein